MKARRDAVRDVHSCNRRTAEILRIQDDEVGGFRSHVDDIAH